MYLSTTAIRIKFVIFFICLIILLFDKGLGVSVIRRPFERFYSFLFPIQASIDQTIKYPLVTYRFYRSGVARITDLEARNAGLIASVAESEFLRKENQVLRQELEKQAASTDLSSQVVARVVTTNTEELIIDRGSGDQVRQDQQVFVQGILIGQVSFVTQNYSIVSIIGSRDFRAVAQTQSSVKGVLEREGSTLRLTNLPTDLEVKENEFIVTAGSVEKNLPMGLPVGQIRRVDNSIQEGMQRAIIDQGIELSTLSVVTVRGVE